MHNNQILSGIPESASDNPESKIREFMQSAKKHPPDAINQIKFQKSCDYKRQITKING